MLQARAGPMPTTAHSMPRRGHGRSNASVVATDEPSAATAFTLPGGGIITGNVTTFTLRQLLPPFWWQNSTRSAAATRGAVGLLPYTLSSGPESGFCNQVYALVGWAYIASKREMPLILPNWTSHDQGGYNIAFEKLFAVQPFVDALRAVNITVHSADQVPSGMQLWRPSVQEGGGPLAGWRKYKAIVTSGVDRAFFSSLERAVFVGLVPAPALRERVDAVKRERLGGRAYGCLHARIESDMLKSWRVNRAGPPPTLAHFLQSMARLDELTRLTHVFVAVGVAISAKDNDELSQPTSWGAHLVRTSTGKTWHRGRRNTSEPAYVEAAIVDFYTCREAEWLVGWPGTTFGRTLAALQIFDHNRAWYMVCPPGKSFNSSAGKPTIRQSLSYRGHVDCMPPRQQHNATSTTFKSTTQPRHDSEEVRS